MFRHLDSNQDKTQIQSLAGCQLPYAGSRGPNGPAATANDTGQACLALSAQLAVVADIQPSILRQPWYASPTFVRTVFGLCRFSTGRRTSGLIHFRGQAGIQPGQA